MEKDESLVDLFNQICSDEKCRNKVVLCDYLNQQKREWTLSELDDLTAQLAKQFIQKFNSKRGSCIAIYMNKCAEYVIAYIAALRAGKFILLQI